MKRVILIIKRYMFSHILYLQIVDLQESTNVDRKFIIIEWISTLN